MAAISQNNPASQQSNDSANTPIVDYPEGEARRVKSAGLPLIDVPFERDVPTLKVDPRRMPPFLHKVGLIVALRDKDNNHWYSAKVETVARDFILLNLRH